MLFVILGLVVALRALASAGGYVSIYDLPYHAMNPWPSFIANLFLVQAWNILPYLTWNGASWFVSVEFLLCLLFPLYLFLSRGGALRGAVLVVVGGVVLNYLAQTSGHGLDITFHNGIFRRHGGVCDRRRAVDDLSRGDSARLGRAAGGIVLVRAIGGGAAAAGRDLSQPNGRTSRPTSMSRWRWPD